MTSFMDSLLQYMMSLMFTGSTEGHYKQFANGVHKALFLPRAIYGQVCKKHWLQISFLLDVFLRNLMRWIIFQ